MAKLISRFLGKWLILNANGLTSKLSLSCSLRCISEKHRLNCERYFSFLYVFLELYLNSYSSDLVVTDSIYLLNDAVVDVAAELFVNGEIVQRSPERQRRVEPQPQRAQDRPRYNDRTRYSRRRENTR